MVNALIIIYLEQGQILEEGDTGEMIKARGQQTFLVKDQIVNIVGL